MTERDEDEMHEIDLPSGRWTLVKLRLSSNLLTSADKKFLREKFPNLARQRSRVARVLVEGLALYFRRAYLARWVAKTGRPEGTFPDGKDADEAFKVAAVFCFEVGLAPERYLACAEDTIRCVKYPTPAHIKGPFLRRLAPDWIPPAERVKENGEAPVLAATLLFSAAVRMIPQLHRNWPGVYPVSKAVHAVGRMR